MPAPLPRFTAALDGPPPSLLARTEGRGVIALVTGSRHWTDPTVVASRLDQLHDTVDQLVVVDGAARGADSIANDWAVARPSVGYVRFPANWDRYNKGAGAVRNQRMVSWAAACAENGWEVKVLAFKAGFDWSLRRGGTEDLVRRAKVLGIHGAVIGTPRPQQALPITPT